MSITAYIQDIFNNPGKYQKFWIALAGFAITTLTTYFPDASWLTPLTAFLTAIGVLQIPNKKG
jgi:hypothetical protein